MRMRYFSLNLFALALFIVDRILKYYFLKNSATNLGGDFISGLLNFHFEKNTGIAFGILINQVFLLALIVFVILILVCFLVRAYRQKDWLTTFSLTLIIVGAISNLIDRMCYGFVIDYIDVPWFTVFNLADCMITIGVGLLLVEIFKKKKASNQIDQLR